jgi:hypothetical protein
LIINKFHIYQNSKLLPPNGWISNVSPAMFQGMSTPPKNFKNRLIGHEMPAMNLDFLQQITVLRMHVLTHFIATEDISTSAMKICRVSNTTNDNVEIWMSTFPV